MAIRLNLGSGANPLDGYENLDLKGGVDCRSLPYADGTVDEVRASHLLEHFGYADTARVVEEWVRVLRPGGVLKVSVPDFSLLARTFLAIEDGVHDEDAGRVLRMMMGGQTDADDYHKTQFNAGGLAFTLRRAGLIGIKPWKGDAGDTSSNPVSINLMGHKPSDGWKESAKAGRVQMIMSLPRLSWTDNSSCTFEACAKLGLGLSMFTGAYWHKTLQNAIEKVVDDADYIVTTDYDSVYSPDDVEVLLSTIYDNPGYDAVACMQTMRTTGLLMMNPESPVTIKDLDADHLKVKSAHFGLTAFRAEALRSLPKPWFASVPDEDGGWGAGSRDPDMWFWDRWAEAGRSLYLLPNQPIGHLETVVTWPGCNLKPVYQTMADYKENGKPAGAHW
jgi:hypothetical protein